MSDNPHILDNAWPRAAPSLRIGSRPGQGRSRPGLDWGNAVTKGKVMAGGNACFNFKLQGLGARE